MTEVVYSDLAGKVIVVTGGSRGIGAQTAREFAAQGANVCIVGRDRSALDEVANGIEKDAAAGGAAHPGRSGRVIGVVADVTDSIAIERLRAQVEAELGPVDALAAFAGGEGAPTPSIQLTEEHWRRTVDVNLTSAFLTVHAFLPGMLDRGAGAIVLMSSVAGRWPSQANLAYGVANAGLVMMTRQLATEVGPQGVRINCIAPSTIRTEKVERGMPEQVKEQVAALHPLRRLGTMHDVAQVALFLASDAASWLTGITVDVAGGRVTS